MFKSGTQITYVSNTTMQTVTHAPATKTEAAAMNRYAKTVETDNERDAMQDIFVRFGHWRGNQLILTVWSHIYANAV